MIGFNMSHDQTSPSKNCGIANNVPQFSNCPGCERDLKDNKHNTLHLGQK